MSLFPTTRRRCARGSSMTMGIVVSLVITSLVAVMALVAGQQSQSTGDLARLDQAFFAAESGAQQVAWYCKNGQMASISSPVTGTVNGYAYATSWTTGAKSSLAVSSRGVKGAASYAMSTTVTPPSPGVAAFASAGDFDNKNVIITGDVMTAGNYSNSGSGSLDGDLIYANAASSTATVSGSVTKGSFVSINFSTLDTTLRAGATEKSATAAYDFTNMTGANKVIYVKGDVTGPVITGSGTLYVDGKVTFTNKIDLGTVSDPINIVATGDVTFTKTSQLVGGLYTKGNWNRAQFDIIGCVYVGGVMPSNSGASTLTMTQATVPWFDPRVTTGNGQSVLTFANFAGPQP